MSALAIGLLAACGEGFTTPAGDEGALITWGSTAVLYESSVAGFPNDNPRLIRNFLAYLGTGRGPAGRLRLLYTSTCDPRVDPQRCQISSDPTIFDPFFAMVDQVGTLEFARPFLVTLSDYDAVIADFCDLGTEPSECDALRAYLGAGGRVLVLADNFCFPRDGTGTPVASSALANLFLEPYGIRFTSLDPQPRDPFGVSPGHPLLEGVETLSIFRVAPQIIEGEAAAVVVSDGGVLAAVARIGS